MKKVLKNTLVTLLLLVLILSPFAILVSTVLLLPPQFENDFVGALDEKFERLNSVDEDKIIVVGGSSVAFGLDSELLSEALGMPVVNFGLYAALGTKLMLDLSLSGVSEGDVVVLAPELAEQTLSMYFSSEHTLAAMDSNYSMLKYIKGDNRYSVLGGFWNHGVKKLDRYINGAPDPEGVYNAGNFNEYGDIVWDRKENVMARYYDPSSMIELSPDMIDGDFSDYLNKYIKICKSRGASVYFTYSPMNEMAIADGADPQAVESLLSDILDCDVISYIDDYIMEAGYFYDTNYHLCDAGVIKRTRNLAVDLSFAMGVELSLDIDVPDAPPLPEREYHYFGEDENERFFIYETLESGAKRIIGLSEEGMTMESLTVPLGADGFKVTELDTGIFVGSSVRSLTVTEDSNLRQFFGVGFGGSSVTDIYILYDHRGVDSEALYPTSDFGGVKAHVKRGSLWPEDYLWDPIAGIEFVYDLE